LGLNGSIIELRHKNILDELRYASHLSEGKICYDTEYCFVADVALKEPIKPTSNFDEVYAEGFVVEPGYETDYTTHPCINKNALQCFCDAINNKGSLQYQFNEFLFVYSKSPTKKTLKSNSKNVM